MQRTRTSPRRGFTLIECMVALAVMLVGTVGLMGLFSVGVTMNGDARRITRATAIAQDLVNNIEIWDYSESGTGLIKVSTTNTTDIADTQGQFETDSDPVSSGLADHSEATLTALGSSWLGISQSSLGGEYERFWNVLYEDTNSDGVNDIVHIAVIVRWRHGGGWRRVVLQTSKLNPSRV